jgi:hypothetical protein
MENRPVEAALINADRRTDMTVIGIFRNYANVP